MFDIEKKWIIGSRSPSHIVGNISLLKNPKIFDNTRVGTMYLPTGNIAYAKHIGSTYFFKRTK